MDSKDRENLQYILNLTDTGREEFLLEQSTDDLKYALSLLIRYRIGGLRATFADPEEIEKEVDKLKQISYT